MTVVSPFDEVNCFQAKTSTRMSSVHDLVAELPPWQLAIKSISHPILPTGSICPSVV